MNIAIWITIYTAMFIVIFLPLYQRATLAREKKENDKTKDE
jgi:hypothetical protein